MTETSPNIAQRINAAMAEVEYIQKQKPKSGMQYSYVSHDVVTGRVRPILQKHGIVYYPRNLAVTQNGNRTEAVFDVRFENMDDRADFIDVATFGYGVDPQDKGPGKAMSYGVKYALLKVLGLETGDDPEDVQDDSAKHQPAAVAPKANAPLSAEAQAALDAIDLAETNEQLKTAWEKHWASVPKNDRPRVLTAKEAKKTGIDAMNLVTA